VNLTLLLFPLSI